jgi:hypothetical protein
MSELDRIRRLANHYMGKRRGEPVGTREIAAWLVDHQHWAPVRSRMISQCAEVVSRALREDFFTDAQGRRVRSKHSIVDRQAGKQLHFWIDMRTATREQMELSIQHHRQQVFAELLQMHTDKESYNENYNTGEPLQLVLDFTQDVAEANAMRRGAA